MRRKLVGVAIVLVVWGCSRGGSQPEGGGWFHHGGGREPKKHRAAASPCDPARPVGIAPGDASAEPSTNGSCKTDADCTHGRNGRCEQERAGLLCSYDSCAADADCGAGKTCDCGRPGSSSCLTSGCRVDADCGPGHYCSPSEGDCGGYSGTVTYACHSKADDCTDDEDCKEPGATCRFVAAAGHWKCSASHCVGSLPLACDET